MAVLPEAVSVELAFLIAVILAGYLPAIAAYLRHGTQWVFMAYTAFVAAVVLVAVRETVGVQFQNIEYIVALLGSSIFFFISAYRSRSLIREKEPVIADEEVTL